MLIEQAPYMTHASGMERKDAAASHPDVPIYENLLVGSYNFLNLKSAHKDEDIGLPDDIAFLQKFGADRQLLHHAAKWGEAFGIHASEALIANRVLNETLYYRCVAAHLNLPFTNQSVPAGQPVYLMPNATDLKKMARLVRQPKNSLFGSLFHVAPDPKQLFDFSNMLKHSPEAAGRIKVTPLSANMRAIIHRCTPALLYFATNNLVNRFPQFSARRTILAMQVISLCLILQIFAAMAWFSTAAFSTLLHLLALTMYSACIGLRYIAVKQFVLNSRLDGPPWRYGTDLETLATLPQYSVLIPLLREKDQVTGLLDSISKIEWPRERLEVFIICEENDTETSNEVQAHLNSEQYPNFQLLIVPHSQPCTKPKALNFAFPLCNGEFLVVYDAEDRPNPLQLREAYRRFSDENEELCCLQAPLAIRNCDESWIARLFAIEYSALFDGLLPMLASSAALMPLGGTSNHFRRSILHEVGGWDPYNVTEDADLGIRLTRAGYKVGVIRRATYEEAPINFSVWLPQRTRWFKGWLQTWLVHMRNPVALSRDIGLRDTLVFHIMMTGAIISALIHPFLIFNIANNISLISETGLWHVVKTTLFVPDLICLSLGYAVFSWLATETLSVRKNEHLKKFLLLLPLYWILHSLAAWRALWHLATRTHEWEKTPHRLNRHT